MTVIDIFVEQEDMFYRGTDGSSKRSETLRVVLFVVAVCLIAVMVLLLTAG
jgi:hypothetical protein